MPEFGDEFIIESINVPWLIWIQLIVTILLIILLLFGFSIFTADPTSISAASPSAGSAATPPSRPKKSRRKVKVGENRVRGDEETSRELIREEDQSEEESPLKESAFLRFFRFSNHPCSFFGEAKQAFLKCFGLDSSSEASSRHQHEKQE
ncbi:hypothetical protein CASFOL_018607 [Castilleja foliolosa]|uniref:ATP synthase F0 subunit 8 n=1 Tax=Castilleja foliolosa TaxID=1961234 RepID=A0ABD3D6G7_9LAMI